ncbi:MAG: DNA repair protein RecO [Chloroflexi bacterium]|nr:DNA repair protein RecO [Chloroflexota bacterium]
MPRERLYRVEAIVLKRTDHGEADRLLTLLTPDLGKLRAIAKGARKPSSRKSGHVELFAHTHLLVAKGKQLDVVTQADTLDAFLELRENLERVGYAYYLAELVDRFSEEGTEHRATFALLLRALAALNDATTEPDLLARFFELRLLQYVGYRPQLFNCIHCGKAIEPVENFFSAEAGGVIDPDCVQTRRAQIAGRARAVSPTAVSRTDDFVERGENARNDAQTISLDALKILRYLQTREWETVRGLRFAERGEAMSEVESLMLRYITHHLERNLKSVEFLRELKAGLYAAKK